jgi:hypothetical protein
VAAGETRTYAKHVHSYLQVAFKQLPEVALDLVAGQGSDQISTIVANDLGSVAFQSDHENTWAVRLADGCVRNDWKPGVNF